MLIRESTFAAIISRSSGRDGGSLGWLTVVVITLGRMVDFEDGVERLVRPSRQIDRGDSLS